MPKTPQTPINRRDQKFAVGSFVQLDTGHKAKVLQDGPLVLVYIYPLRQYQEPKTTYISKKYLVPCKPPE